MSFSGRSKDIDIPSLSAFFESVLKDKKQRRKSL